MQLIYKKYRMKPIFFLDIDGVIATDNENIDIVTKDFMNENVWAKELKVPYPFNQGCVAILNDILKQTDADIVLSSDWKKHWTLEQLDIIFKKNGVIKSPIDITPKDFISFRNIERNRAHQIEKYIKDNEVEKYVIVDDLWLEFYLEESKPNFVRTEGYYGIKEPGIKENILNILQK